MTLKTWICGGLLSASLTLCPASETCAAMVGFSAPVSATTGGFSVSWPDLSALQRGALAATGCSSAAPETYYRLAVNLTGTAASTDSYFGRSTSANVLLSQAGIYAYRLRAYVVCATGNVTAQQIDAGTVRVLSAVEYPVTGQNTQVYATPSASASAVPLTSALQALQVIASQPSTTYGFTGYQTAGAQQRAFRALSSASGLRRMTETSPLDSPPPVLDNSSLALGRNHTCALGAAYALRCWGENGIGQLGDSSTFSKSRTTIPVGQPTFASVSAGEDHVCGVSTSGQLYCWGSNEYGELGVRPSVVSSIASPRLVEATQNWVAAASGQHHSCALRTESNSLTSVWCWGSNEGRQLGYGGNRSSFTPTKIPIIDPTDINRPEQSIHAVTLGEQNTCVLTKRGRVYCWGANESGQLGSGTTTSTAVPQQLPFQNWINVSAGSRHICGIRKSDDITSMMCWGSNRDGEIGNGQVSEAILTPTEISSPALKSWGQVFAGGSSTCAVLREDSSLMCWGNNRDGQLGLGSVLSVNSPQPIKGIFRWETLAVGESHTCGRSTDKAVYCWGDHSSGQLADAAALKVLHEDPLHGATPSGVLLPLAVRPGAARSIAAGRAHACALDTQNDLYCWGMGQTGAAGSGLLVDMPTPNRIAPPASGAVWDWIVAGGDTTCARAISNNPGGTQQDALYCWGANAADQISAGDQINKTTPVMLIPVEPPVGSAHLEWVAMAVGDSHSCAISRDLEVSTQKTLNRLYCWGGNLYSQSSPEGAQKTTVGQYFRLPGDDWASVEVGLEHACGVRQGGGVDCWGANFQGQVGNTPTRVSVVTQPTRVASAASVALGREHSCALTQVGQGAVLCWGSNDAGQLGIGDRVSRKAPTPSLATNLLTLRASGSLTCGLTAQGGKLVCWGAGRHGVTTPSTGNGLDSVIPRELPGQLQPITSLAVGDEFACGVSVDGKVLCWGREISGERGNGAAVRVMASTPGL